MQLSVPGRHNVLNALAAVAMARELGIAFSDITRAIAGFQGAERRFQRRGEVKGITLVEDYGHHPTEIAAVIAAAKPIASGRLLVAFQPHRFTRTQFLMNEFGRAFAGADVVILTDIYGAGEDPIEGITLEALAKAVEGEFEGELYVAPSLGAVPQELARLALPGDLIVLLGAGSIGSLAGAVLTALGLHRRRGAEPLMPVTAPADKRFRRAHMKPARKRSGWRFWRWRTAVAVATVGLAFYAAHRAVAIVEGLEVFHIERIVVRGNQRLSNGEVLALLQGLRGRSILSVDLEEWRRALLKSPWVADAALRRTLPSTVDVTIEERCASRHRAHRWCALPRRRSGHGHR